MVDDVGLWSMQQRLRVLGEDQIEIADGLNFRVGLASSTPKFILQIIFSSPQHITVLAYGP
jgi:hypothetical protein